MESLFASVRSVLGEACFGRRLLGLKCVLAAPHVSAVGYIFLRFGRRSIGWRLPVSFYFFFCVLLIMLCIILPFATTR